jgi:prevent-host-death family protein
MLAIPADRVDDLGSELVTSVGGESTARRRRPRMCYFMCVMEQRVGVRELRQNLSVYLRRVKMGERLTVTERGQVVARLEPIVDDDDPIARLERGGRILRRGSGDLSRIRPLKLDLERSLSAILEEMREDTV